MQVALAARLITTRESITRSLYTLTEPGVLRRFDRRHCEVLEQDLSGFDAISKNA